MKKKSTPIIIKNFSAGRKTLRKNIILYGGSAIALFQFLDFLLERPSISNLVKSLPYYSTYIEPVISNILYYLIAAVVIAALKQSSFTNYSKKIKGKDIKIGVRVGDIFKSSDGIIVPSNNMFLHSQREDNVPLIGERSIQAQIAQKCKSKKYTSDLSIDNQITLQLNNTPSLFAAKLPLPPVEIGDEKKYKYEYGTIVPIKVREGKKNEKHFYFLAMSEIKSANNPKTTDADLTKSIENMWKNINEVATDDSYTCPVLATGAAKHFNTPAEIIARFILKSFANYAVSPNARIKEFTLIIRPDDYSNNVYDLDELHNFVDYLCKFPSNETELIKDQQAKAKLVR